MNTAKIPHMLVVDDNELCRKMCTIILTLAGCRVSGASSAPEALRILEVAPPDVLVCDLLLGLSGSGLDIVTAVRIRKLPIFCIAVTAQPTVEVRERAFAAGFDAFLAKPYKPSDLVAMLPPPAE